MTTPGGDAGLPELGIPITTQTPLGHIVSALRKIGHTDVAEMKVLAARYRDQARVHALTGHVAVVRLPEADRLATPPEVREPSARELRAWATSKGIDVPVRGSLRREVYDAYRADVLASMVPFKGGAPIPAEPKD
jgi:hypothetical protein